MSKEQKELLSDLELKFNLIMEMIELNGGIKNSKEFAGWLQATASIAAFLIRRFGANITDSQRHLIVERVIEIIRLSEKKNPDQ